MEDATPGDVDACTSAEAAILKNITLTSRMVWWGWHVLQALSPLDRTLYVDMVDAASINSIATTLAGLSNERSGLMRSNAAQLARQCTRWRRLEVARALLAEPEARENPASLVRVVAQVTRCALSRFRLQQGTLTQP